MARSHDVPCSLVPGQPCVRRDQAASSWVCGADVCKRFPGVTCAMRACAIPITRACTHHPCIYTRVASSARPDGAPDPPHPGPLGFCATAGPGTAFWSRHRLSSAALALLWEGDALRCWRSRSALCARGRPRRWTPPSVYPRLKSPPLLQILRIRAGPRGSVGTGHRPPNGLPTRLGLSRPRLALTRTHGAVSRPRCSRAANGAPAGTGVDCPSAGSPARPIRGPSRGAAAAPSAAHMSHLEMWLLLFPLPSLPRRSRPLSVFVSFCPTITITGDRLISKCLRPHPARREAWLSPSITDGDAEAQRGQASYSVPHRREGPRLCCAGTGTGTGRGHDCAL